MSMGEVRGKIFVKLIEALVVKCREAVHNYKWLDCIEQVQLQAYRIFLGVGRLYPKTSLQIEMGLLNLFEVGD